MLVGDFLFSRAFELMVEDGSLEVLGILSRASSIIAEGEVMQLVTTSDIETTEAAYLEVIGSKTAQLFAAACRIGAVVADRPTSEADALDAYGMNLGIAFQLIDDVLDYSAKQATLGKTIGDDFREGKMTLPVVLALGRADESERGFWQRTLEESRPARTTTSNAAIAILQQPRALADSVERARGYGEAARPARSAVFPDSAGQARAARGRRLLHRARLLAESRPRFIPTRDMARAVSPASAVARMATVASGIIGG